MCMQCLADAHNVFVDRPLLPATAHNGPVWFVQGHYGHVEWPRGWYGLVFLNDPFAVWEWEPTPEPRVPEGRGKKVDAAYAVWHEWYTNASKAAESVNGLDLITAYDLVAACIKAGYDRLEDGDVALWLMGYIGRALKRRRRSTEKEWGEPPFEYQRPRGNPVTPDYQSKKGEA